MNYFNRLLIILLLASFSSFCLAQPAAPSAKEQRQASASKDKPRPDRSQAEAKKLQSGQKEAKDQQSQKLKAADTEMAMGLSSAAVQMGATGGAKKKNEKLDARKDAAKKPVQQPLSGR